MNCGRREAVTGHSIPLGIFVDLERNGAQSAAESSTRFHCELPKAVIPSVERRALHPMNASPRSYGWYDMPHPGVECGVPRGQGT